MGGRSSIPVSLMGVLPCFTPMARPWPCCRKVDIPMSESHQCLRKRTFQSRLSPGQCSTILACKVSLFKCQLRGKIDDSQLLCLTVSPSFQFSQVLCSFWLLNIMCFLGDICNTFRLGETLLSSTCAILRFCDINKLSPTLQSGAGEGGCVGPEYHPNYLPLQAWGGNAAAGSRKVVFNSFLCLGDFRFVSPTSQERSLTGRL